MPARGRAAALEDAMMLTTSAVPAQGKKTALTPAAVEKTRSAAPPAPRRPMQAKAKKGRLTWETPCTGKYAFWSKRILGSLYLARRETLPPYAKVFRTGSWVMVATRQPEPPLITLDLAVRSVAEYGFPNSRGREAMTFCRTCLPGQPTRNGALQNGTPHHLSPTRA